MFSVLRQEKTILRDARGGSVYRRLYLCDEMADLSALPTDDAPGTAVIVADSGESYLLDHGGRWHAVPGMGGALWNI